MKFQMGKFTGFMENTKEEMKELKYEVKELKNMIHNMDKRLIVIEQKILSL